MCFDVPYNFFRNIFHSKNWASSDPICISVFTAKCPFFLLDFNETWIHSTGFPQTRKYQISRKRVKCEPSCSTRRTDMAKLRVVFEVPWGGKSVPHLAEGCYSVSETQSRFFLTCLTAQSSILHICLRGKGSGGYSQQSCYRSRSNSIR